MSSIDIERDMQHINQEILFSEQEIAAAVEKMAAIINAEYRLQNFDGDQTSDRRVLAIGILKGAAIFMADLVRRLEFPLELDFMRVSSYGSGRQSSSQITVGKEPDVSLAGRDILLIEDVVDTGQTIRFLIDYCLQRQASSVKVVALIDKPAQRRTPVSVDFSCLEAPDDFLFGYGMDNAEADRNLPYIVRIIQ